MLMGKLNYKIIKHNTHSLCFRLPITRILVDDSNAGRPVKDLDSKVTTLQ